MESGRKHHFGTTATLVVLCLSMLASPAAAAGTPVNPPHDPLWGEQWAYASTPGVGINLLEAWKYTKGDGAVIAIVDSGLVAHPEFDGRVLPGYDFVSNPAIGGDGDGRDADPSDPGDWVSSEDIANGTVNPNCDTEDSVWHGTHVAGIVAASADNAIGVAGVAPEASILPVRVIGKCGGSEADMIDGIRWAAGLSVDGAPENVHPADIINVSLGGAHACSSQFQSTVDLVSALDIIIVASVGNEAHDASLSSPANCLGTLAVAALNADGQRAFYSNYGAAVDLSAPGGDRAAGIISTVDIGARTPEGPGYKELIGTSMAAPMVSGVLALARSIDPSTPRVELLTILVNHLAPFAEDSAPLGCTLNSLCGVGVVNAGSFLDALEERVAPQVISSVPLGMRIGMKQPLRVFVNDRMVNLSLEATDVCTLTLGVLRGEKVGTCTLSYREPGTVEVRNINLNYVVRIVKTATPRVKVAPPKRLRVGERASLMVTAISSGRRTFTSLTPDRCRVARSGAVLGVRSGSCRIQLRIAPANGFLSRTGTVTFRVSP